MNILQYLKVKFQCTYLYGLADVNMNLSPNPFSSHSILCIFAKALQEKYNGNDNSHCEKYLTSLHI